MDAWYGEGLGGEDIAKLSILRPVVRRYVERLGKELDWHAPRCSVFYPCHFDAGLASILFAAGFSTKPTMPQSVGFVTRP
jgi:hypothetical protein